MVPVELPVALVDLAIVELLDPVAVALPLAPLAHVFAARERHDKLQSAKAVELAGADGAAVLVAKRRRQRDLKVRAGRGER